MACEFPKRCGNLANCYTLVTYLLSAFARRTPLLLTAGRAAIDPHLLPVEPAAARLHSAGLLLYLDPCWGRQTGRQTDAHRTVT